jgi:hypothetical protein
VAQKCPAWDWHRWLTPVILATQEAEIRRITVRSQPGKIVHKILAPKYPSQKRAGAVVQGEDPEFKTSTAKKKKKKKKEKKSVLLKPCVDVQRR